MVKMVFGPYMAGADSYSIYSKFGQPRPQDPEAAEQAMRVDAEAGLVPAPGVVPLPQREGEGAEGDSGGVS